MRALNLRQWNYSTNLTDNWAFNIAPLERILRKNYFFPPDHARDSQVGAVLFHTT